MRCGCCGQNQAVKTYEETRNGKKTIEYYCLECYHKLFLDAEERELVALDACPYCGMTATEFRSGKLVGCAYCYRTMGDTVLPAVKKMQGEKSHRGKTPPLFDDDEGRQEREGTMAAALEMQQARYEKQCNELELIINKLKAEGNYADAKGYADKLSVMKSKQAVEEEFVWRTRLNLSKQS